MGIRFFLFVFLIVAFYSCQSGDSKQVVTLEEPELKRFTGARLVQVDSIMIDLIGNFKVYDYQPESGLFLGGDIGTFMIIMGSAPKRNELGHVVFNRKGEILHQFNNANSGPSGHSTGAMSNAFLGPDDIGVMSMKALYRYGLDGTLREKYTAINALDVAGHSMQRMLYATDARHVAVGLPKGKEDATRAWDSIYQILKPLWFYDLNRFSSTSLNEEGNALMASHGYPDHPVYAPESEISTSPFPPHMSVNHKKNELYAVYPNIPTAEVYDMNSGRLKDEIDLAPEHFEVEAPMGSVSGGTAGHKGLLWSNKGGRIANAKYREVIQLGEYSLFRYSPALPPSAIKELVNGKGMLGENEYWPRIRKKHYRFYYQLFKDGEKVLPDFELPLLEPKPGDFEMANDVMTKGKLIGGNGLDEIFVFVPNNGEVERDYELIRVYKLELVTE